MARKLTPAQIAERKARVTKGVRLTGASRYGGGTLKHVSTTRSGQDSDTPGSPSPNPSTRPPGIDQRKLTPKR